MLGTVWGVCLLGAALTGCALFARKTPEVTPTLAPTSTPQQPPSQTRVKEWVQTSAADFGTGEREGLAISDADGGELHLAAGAQTGVYTSTIVDADMGFNAIVPRWQVDTPAQASTQIEVRVYSAGQGWSAWHAFSDATMDPEGKQAYPETPLMLLGGERFQYRATLASAADQGSPVLHEVALIYMDTSVGPTTMQAKAFTTMGQPARGVPQPAIISREGWGADESYLDWTPEYEPSLKIVVHHTVTTNDYTEEQAAQWVRAIYYYHAVILEWGDIGYNYLVDRYGNVYQGRYGGPDAIGGHVYSYNAGSTGIAVIGTHGNYADSVPATDASISALQALGAWEAARAHIHPLVEATFLDAVTPNLAGHRDFPPQRTSCPGDDLYAQLPGLRRAVWQRMSAYLVKYDVEWLKWTEPATTTLQAGQTYHLSITVRNSGSLTWTHAAEGPSVRLGYHWIDAQGQTVTQPAQDDHRTPVDGEVPFGGLHRFDTVLVTTPITPGTYTLAWDMVHEGVTWFHDAVPGSPELRMTLDIVPLPTPTPTPTPDPGIAQNGGFEYDGAWTMFETAYPARYVQEPRRSGARALQTGIEDVDRNVYSYSSAEQAFVLPVVGDRTLRYWYRAAVAQGDYVYVFLRADAHGWRPLSVSKDSTDGWVQVAHDLSAYAGQQVTLRFGTFNDGRGGISAMYVDDVGVGSVDPVQGTPTPAATFTPQPTATWTPTPLPSPTETPMLIPTATPVPTWTPVPTATLTPSPTATPLPACAELVTNGDFEGDGGWTIPITPYRARYTRDASYVGDRSLQLGIADPAADRWSYSSAEQRVAVPAGRRAKLRFWYHMPQSGGAGDYGYFMLRPDGGSWRVIRIVRDSTSDWTPLEVDVSHYGGQGLRCVSAPATTGCEMGSRRCCTSIACRLRRACPDGLQVRA